MVGLAPRADRLFRLFPKTNMGNNMFETTLSIEFKNVPHRILILEVEKKIIFFSRKIFCSHGNMQWRTGKALVREGARFVK